MLFVNVSPSENMDGQFQIVPLLQRRLARTDRQWQDERLAAMLILQALRESQHGFGGFGAVRLIVEEYDGPAAKLAQSRPSSTCSSRG